ncbi:TetR/AcrR family transcriptional regulator [Ensifer sesbaniae]|jgi:AcrR family transcriptional regulator|uniref:TetR/AcrR family transcriptional regulator n=1 Tax=Ensifer sesbaniae TaxID=1214071 RepID=UPI00156A5B7A|nr:TetR/AcrR family transcriptional regulator [Ensifer sesbaniae]MCK3780513.1 TetR/AcrR family transcriptional regulator [Ensifer sesbaniae]NRQ18870.1 HTH-type transcriptional regulator BetI [Ensifer sesbaniae]
MAPTKSRKLAKPERRAQLIETAKAILRECGADALTLGHLAERAGVSKPIAYEHFGTREGLLIALSQEIEDRHATKLRTALAGAPKQLGAVADIISSVYIDCAVDSGEEWQAISAALRGNADMIATQQQQADDYVAMIEAALGPFAKISAGDLRLRCTGIAGAAEAIGRELIRGRTNETAASANLAALIVDSVDH